MNVEEAARMNHSVLEMSRGVRRRLEDVVRKSPEKDYARRALALLQLWETGGNVSEVAQPFPGNGHSVAHLRSAI